MKPFHNDYHLGWLWACSLRGAANRRQAGPDPIALKDLFEQSPRPYRSPWRA